VLWILLWLVLLAGAAVVLFLLGRRLVHQGLAVMGELAVAGERVQALQDELARLEVSAERPHDAAVFADAAALRREHERIVRRSRRRRHRAARRR
jgi:hypothetical protein